MTKKTAKIIGIIAIILFVLVVAINSFKIIPTGYTGVRSRFGQISSNAIAPGIALKIPFVDNIILVNNKQQEITIEGQIWGETSERAALYYEGINITYQINPARSSWLVANVTNYERNILSSSFVASAVKTAAKQYNSIDATNRGIIEPAITQTLQTSINEKYGEDTITIIKVVVNNADYEDSYNMVIAEQQAAQIQYQTQQIENQRAIEQAEAQATVTRTTAQAQADAMIIAAEAEAEANAIREESLTPTIIQYETITRWDGRLPILGNGSDNSVIPMIDVSSLTADTQTVNVTPAEVPSEAN
ncbi:MAG: hypothetical protein IJ757_04395 [Clostridiales bacterium]|nr:hypothetical protein [Clostridiales bacterium]